MGFFGRFFNNKPATNQLNIPFGRYSDAYKTDLQYQLWDNAVQAYDEENYLKALEFFLHYLKDEKGSNVKEWMDDGVLKFEIIQGSKKIIGSADSQHIEVEAKVAHTEGLKVAFMRQLMERNYALKYSRFALDENDDISMRFDTDLIDASPYKLFNALKEVAINSDKLDDLLIDEYDVLSPINNQHIGESTEAERETKYQFVHQWISKTLEITKSLNKRELAAGVAYLLLDLTYKMDYLIKPEGFLMETLERIHRRYFERDGLSVDGKCQMLVKEFEKVLARSKEDLQKEMYHTIATFGITAPVNHDKVVSFIDGELSNMDWYIRNHYPNIALAIPGYIAGYCMFEFAVPKPDRELLHLYFEIVEAPYFTSLGYKKQFYNSNNGKFDKAAIRQRIHQIVKSNQEKYPYLQSNTSILDFKNLQSFAYSYMMMIRALDLSVD